MEENKRNNGKIIELLIKIVVVILLIFGVNYIDEDAIGTYIEKYFIDDSFSNIGLDLIPEYTDKKYVEINNNKPFFKEEEYTIKAFETYSNLDEKGRCGVAYANVCKEIMPKSGEIRESISQVKPSGWKQKIVNGDFIYNRCHLIAYQLAGENANEKNLITGTRYFNVEGMLPFENKVAEYISKNKKNHVLYRVTPIFKGNNLLASGVEMEAYSVEDNGKGVCFNVFVYNVQPGVKINYSTGKVK